MGQPAMFNMILNAVRRQSKEEQKSRLYRELIAREARIGSELFGPIPRGARREFFCLNEYTWVWHEEWTDDKGIRRAVTTRYDVRPDRVLKAQDGQPYRYVGADEARHLCQAVKLYNERVQAELYPVKL